MFSITLKNVARTATKSSTGRYTSLRMPQAVCAQSSRAYSSTMHDNDPEVLEKEKNRNLSKTQHKTSTPHAHAPGWNEHLASASEASVKADRSTGTTDELQRSTVDYVQARHSPDDRSGATSASQSHDSVSGPLSSAQGSADKEVEVLTRKTVEKQTTEVHEKLKPTHSEDNVKADRGEI